MMRDQILWSAVENLRSEGPDVNADIAVVVEFLDRKEIDLIRLKNSGLSDEVIEACFLLSSCGNSLVPEQIGNLCANPMARSGKMLEIRSLIDRGDPGEFGDWKWSLVRESLVKALDILENGNSVDSLPEWEGKQGGDSDDSRDESTGYWRND
ncbi:MAG: hypothetical protein Q7I97_09335 [Thermovirgaceae bacterium]|nr:hypothetical protein [Thermovirgaceae bacterium]